MSTKNKTNKSDLPTAEDFLGLEKNVVENPDGLPPEGIDAPVNTMSEDADAPDDQEDELTDKQERPKYIAKAKRPVLNEDGSVYEGPTVRMKREDGKFLGRRAIDFQGLSSEMLPPITRRKTATYEVITKGYEDPLSPGKVIDPVPVIIPGSYVLYDPFDKDVLKRHKTLKNVTRFENKIEGGKNVPYEVVDEITFDSGFKVVAIEKEYMMYVLLELHPLNESNRWRDKSQPAAFRRTDMDSRKWGNGSIVSMDLEYEAEKTVVDMRSADEIIALAHAAGIPTLGRKTDNGDDSIKKDLRLFARKNPRDFFKLNKNDYAAIKVSVLDAIELGLIEYEVDKKAWFFSTDGERIGAHLPGEDSTDALIKMFMKNDYKPHYKKMQNQLNYWD